VIEPTDEMRAAYVAAYDPWADPDEVMEARLAAVLAIVERDYRTEPRPPWEKPVNPDLPCPRCGQEDVDGVRWVDMTDQCIADVCPARDAS